MKTAVSIPDDLFDSVDALAKKLRFSRSRLYAVALAEFLAKYRGRRVTERLNAVYRAEESRLNRAIARAQTRSLSREPW